MPGDTYDGTVAYARAKRAQLVLLHEWVRRTAGTGVSFHAMHPGWAATPGIRDSLPGFARVMGPLLRTADQGADTAVWLAVGPGGRRDERRVLARPPTALGAQGPVDAPVGRGVRRCRRRAVGVVRRPHRVGRPDRDPSDGVGVRRRGDARSGAAQLVKPYRRCGPMAANSNMPYPTWSPQVNLAAYSVSPQAV